MIKKYLFILLVLVISSNCFSTTITSTASGGEWSTGATWNGGSVPSTEDTVIILSTATVTVSRDAGFDGTVGDPTALDIVLIVDGELSLVYTAVTNPGPDRVGIWLTNTSIVVIPVGGEINSSSNAPGGDDNFISVGIDVPPVIEYLGNRDGTVTGPAVIIAGETGPLPIELISFDTKLSGDVVNISWATASEINNEFFTLERSVDGINWRIIGEVDGAGNSSERIDYSFMDYNPIPGLSYYRLKQTDFDGKFEYFTPSVISYEPDNLFKVFPNPTVDVIQLTTSSNLQNATTFIKDLNGHQKISQIARSQHQATIDLTALPTGVYILEIVFPESVLSRRIVKN